MPLMRIDEAAGLELVWRIDAPRVRVWQCLTVPSLLSQWLGELVSGEIASGESFVVDHGEGYCCESVVAACAEPSRLDFTWEFPDEPRSGVAVKLEESRGVTTLRVSHAGLGELAPSYRTGWCVHLSYLEAAALAMPMPPAMFWQLHETLVNFNLR